VPQDAQGFLELLQPMLTLFMRWESGTEEFPPFSPDAPNEGLQTPPLYPI
jgi:hypothetical protein